ncbi:hypothetical protein, partial [Enterobacter cloacae complex sp. GF14B]|uniref:hypothetical protein n=1 Tax=Enterobacter cloacae complex sp. GF14B TaxID=2511982 RepID=UPI001027AA9C
MIVGSFQLIQIPSESTDKFFYEYHQGQKFHLISTSQSQKPTNPIVFKQLHVTKLTYAYQDAHGNEYQQDHDLVQTPMDGKTEVKDYLKMMQSLKLPEQDTKKAKSMKARVQKATQRSSPKSPPKSQILPESIVHLLRSKVTQMQAHNAQQLQEKGAILQQNKPRSTKAGDQDKANVEKSQPKDTATTESINT